MRYSASVVSADDVLADAGGRGNLRDASGAYLGGLFHCGNLRSSKPASITTRQPKCPAQRAKGIIEKFRYAPGLVKPSANGSTASAQ